MIGAPGTQAVRTSRAREDLSPLGVQTAATFLKKKRNQDTGCFSTFILSKWIYSMVTRLK